MAVTQTAQACDLVIFGAKGDLARRKLLPSLYQLEKAGQIHPDTRILGCRARRLGQGRLY
ncbi:glucose-6-phosphate 1-dehydrogenase [Enterobacter asburiae]|uniref:Glucose-6-phosphate 1-dehydrogenase n=1 Tax=Enterobacter asburiae TaxID=61645 RepID=A0A376FBY3_ENTAS|nr:glucose-6-phosphate 1-dehydrogenase [Enterobacter asburiae]